MPHLPQRFYGIAFYITAMLSFSAMNVTIRSMAGIIDPLQMVFCRNVISFFLLLPFVLRHGVSQLKTTRPVRHFLRSFIGLIAMETWFIGLMSLPVNSATALSFTAPLFSTLFAVIFLKERIGWMRVGALAIGFGGVLIIANPTADDAWNMYALMVLGSTAGMAIAGILVKTLTTTEPSWRIVFYMALIMSLLSFPPALSVWESISTESMIYLVMIAIFSTIAQYALAQALRHEMIVVLAPFEFTRLVFTAAIAWVILSEPLGLNTVLGSTVIVGSAVFIAWRERVKNKRILASEVA